LEWEGDKKFSKLFMTDRKMLILNTIIKEHIKTGLPVGSGILVEKYKLDISPATVRNEMAVLEDEGFIVQPHTSAGRVPTEKAYLRFLEELQIKKVKNSDFSRLDDHLSQEKEAEFKEAAKMISDLSGNAVFWAFHRYNLYYTGISNLFQQPEFSQLDMIHDISAVIDRMDEIVDEIFGQLEFGVHTVIGSKNPFGTFCGSVLLKYKKGENTGLLGILGPMRMDYEKNLGIINYINERLMEE
jgi:transcriptional regulator of heat shock response